MGADTGGRGDLLVDDLDKLSKIHHRPYLCDMKTFPRRHIFHWEIYRLACSPAVMGWGCDNSFPLRKGC